MAHGLLNLTDQAIFHAVELLARIPERVLFPLVDTRLKRNIPYSQGADFLMSAVRVMHRSWTSFHPNVRRRFVQNIFGHLMIRDRDRRRRACDLLGDYPLLMVVSPTMRCNLRCDGCYAYHYDREDALSTERLHRLYDECEELGIRFIVVSGGEPYLRDDTLELFAAHPNLYFLTYTNGTIISERHLAPRLAELGNVLPCLSVEGFEVHTDARRGPGTHRRVLRAMRDLHEAGVLFGYSATPTRETNELLVSDRFVEFYLEQGCRVAWYFSYMPLGRDPDLDLMPTPSQRLHRFHRMSEIRRKYDVVTADFWCDGMLTGGCLSGGRTYFHINASGGVEPCVFNQFHLDNINDKSLVECLQSPFMRDIRCRLRQVKNPMRPCLIIDNPQVLRELVATHAPHASQPGGEAILNGKLAEGLDRYSRELAELFDPLFQQDKNGFPWPLEPLGTMEEKEAAWRSSNGRRGSRR